MASFFAAIGDLFKSFYELIAAFVGTIVHLVEGILAGIINFFTSIINLFGDVLAGVVDVVGGIGKFVVGNIVILGIVAAGGFLYMRSQQQQGRQVGVGKKTN